MENKPKNNNDIKFENVLESNTNDKTDFTSYKFKHDHSELKDKYDFKNKKLTSNMNKINFVVTHGSCIDGFMSATIVQLWAKNNGINVNDMTFYNAYYGSDFSKLPELMRNKYVIVCDFSFPKLLFDKMIEATNGNILVLDHHKTAQKNLQGVLSEYLTFDMKHAGAFITWTYFFGFDNVPKSVLYVEDNDIWNKVLPQTREFTAAIYSQKYEFSEYEKFFDDKYLLEYAFPVGKGMVIQNDSFCEQLSKKCIPQFMEIAGRYYFVACLNSAGILRSELGNYIFGVFKNVNFSMVYAHDHYSGITSISYRSTDERTDVSEIAKFHGGGGHRNAAGAGASFKVDTPPGRVVDSYRAYYILDYIYTVTVNNKNFMMVNTSSVGKHLVKYLMQERFVNDEYETKNESRIKKGLPGFQEGLCLLKNITNNANLDEVYSGAIAWHYSGLTKKYKLIGKFLPGVLSAELLKKIKLMTETTGITPIITISIPDKYEFTCKDFKNNLYSFSFSDSIPIQSFLSDIVE